MVRSERHRIIGRSRYNDGFFYDIRSVVNLLVWFIWNKSMQQGLNKITHSLKIFAKNQAPVWFEFQRRPVKLKAFPCIDAVMCDRNFKYSKTYRIIQDRFHLLVSAVFGHSYITLRLHFRQGLVMMKLIWKVGERLITENHRPWTKELCIQIVNLGLRWFCVSM